jgi:hypothetical protein
MGNTMKQSQIIFIGLLILFSGCALPMRPVCIHNDEICQPKTNFTERWYDYYEWAMTYKDCQCYDLAVNDLNTAISRRPHDKRRMNTYGMHNIDYFPHREKGIILFYQNKFDEAEDELEQSIQSQPSAKAHKFLNHVRKSIIEQKSHDISIPDIQLECPQSHIHSSQSPYQCEILTKDEEIRVQGMIADPHYLSEILIDQSSVLIDLSRQFIPIHHMFKLPEGDHTIPITATNLMGISRTVRLRIQVDRSGPLISMDQWTDHSITGQLMDNSKILSLTANGRNIPVETGTKTTFVISPLPHEKSITIIASDTLDNQTSATFKRSLWTSHYHHQKLMASNEQKTISDTTVLANMPESMQIKLFELKESDIFFREHALVHGEVIGKHNLSLLTIDIQKPDSDNWQQVLKKTFQKGRYIVFNQSIKLEPGNNKIRMKAMDMCGHSIERIVEIQRKIPEAMKIECRYAMNVMPFKPIHVSEEFAQIVSQFFLQKMVNQHRFQVLEQSNGTFTNLFQKTPARFTCEGIINQSTDGTEVLLRIYDHSTSKIIYADIFDEFIDKNPKQLSSDINILVQKIMQMFPLVIIQLTHVQKNQYIAFFNHNQFPIDWEFIAYTNQCSDQLRGSDTIIIGDACIKEKRDDSSCQINVFPKTISKKARWIISK